MDHSFVRKIDTGDALHVEMWGMYLGQELAYALKVIQNCLLTWLQIIAK